MKVLNLIAKRLLSTSFTVWKAVKQDVEDVEETCFVVKRRVVMERITYFRPKTTEKPDLKRLRKVLFADKQRELLILSKFFSRLKRPKTIDFDRKSTDKSMDEKTSSEINSPLPVNTEARQNLLSQLLSNDHYRARGVLVNTWGVLRGKRGVNVGVAGPAFANMLRDILTTYVYKPVVKVLKGAEPSRIQSPRSPMLSSTVSFSTGRFSLRNFHFSRLLKAPFRSRLKWSFRLLSSFLSKLHRRRYYRIQKGIKALYNASILSSQTEVFELLKFLLYLESRRLTNLKHFPLFAYPKKEVVACQRLVRGFLGRRKAGYRRLARGTVPQSLVLKYGSGEKFIVRIQKAVRGFLGRLKAAKLRERKSVRPAVLHSRLIVLVNAVQKAMNRYLAGFVAKLVLRKRRLQTKLVIRLQRGSKTLLHSLKSIGFRRLTSLPYPSINGRPLHP